MQFKRYQPFTPITESLGANRSVELDPVTGAVTILDESRGVTLTALQTLVLMGFLMQHEATLDNAAYAALAQREE